MPAPRKKGDDRLLRVQTVSLAEFRSLHCWVNFPGERATDVLDVLDPPLGIPALFERQDGYQQVDISSNRPDAIAAPSPELRRNIIGDLYSVLAERLGQLQVEIRKVYKNHHVGSPLDRRLLE